MRNIQPVIAVAAICLLMSTAKATAQVPSQEAKEEAEREARRTAVVIKEGTQHYYIGYSTPNYIVNFIDEYSGKHFFGPLTAAYEYAIFDRATIGVQGAYSQGKSSKVLFMDSKGQHSFPVNYQVFALCFRANYHFLSSNKWDIYTGIIAGYGAAVGKINTGELVEDKEVHSDVVWKINAGGRYMFTPNIGVYAEAGYSSVLGLFTFGITGRLDKKEKG